MANEYRRRLQELTGITDIWEEYTPTSPDGSSASFDDVDPELGDTASFTHSLSPHNSQIEPGHSHHTKWSPESTSTQGPGYSLHPSETALKMVRNAICRSGGRGRKNTEKTRIARLALHKAWGRSIKRVQGDLGLLSPVPSKPGRSVVFISIDLEAYELDQTIITEVGVAIFDTQVIETTPPGKHGEDWFPAIRAHHLRIEENAWAHNTRYVRGCASMFNFGTSQVVKLDNVGARFKGIIREAFLASDGPYKVLERPMVLVFHDSKQDVKYLGTLGIDTHETHHLAEIVDTCDMYRYLSRSDNRTKLTTILNELGLEYSYLHNAGNDAVYTMQAMIGLAIQSRDKSLQDASAKTGDPDTTLAEQEHEGWSSGSDLPD